MKAYSHQSKLRLFSYSVAAGSLLLLALPASAYFLDNFSTGKTGWTDTLNGGSVVAVGAGTTGKLMFTTATGNNSLTASIKTASPTTVSLGVSFTPVIGHTTEIRVDATNAFNASQDANAQAVLALVPSGGTVLAANGGYSMTVGANDVIIQKGTTVLASFTGLNFARTNIQLVLRITPSGGGADINARVYRVVTPGLSGQYQTAIFDQTVNDPSGSLVGVAGNVALAVKNVANPSGSTVTFDNLQVWDIINSLLDDFSSGIGNWTTFGAKQSGAADCVSGHDCVTVHDGIIDMKALNNGGAGFAGAVYANRSFALVDGARIEFSVDVIQNIDNGSAGAGAFSVIGFVPATGPTAVTFLKALIEYHVAVDPGNVYNGKTYNGWWGFIPGSYPLSNMRLTITMTGQRNSEGTNIVTESRAEDLSIAVNTPGRVFYQNVVIDTIGQDVFETDPGYPISQGTANALFGGNRYTPFVSPPIIAGSFAIDCFNALPNGAPFPIQITMDNAVFNQTLPPNLPPILNNLSPGANANFIASSSHVVFDASDDSNLSTTGMVVTLNGVSYNSSSGGVTITGTQTARHFDLAGALAANVNYTGTISLTDVNGGSNVTAIAFDTFLSADYTIETEEYNYNNGTSINNPSVIAEGGTSGTAYNGQTGVAEIDFHDNRGALDGDPEDHTFRTDDFLRTQRSADSVRTKYSTPGGAAAGFYEQEIEDIRDGDWMNYTHNYPSGTYNVYLRASQYAVPISIATLDLVVSDPTVTPQTNIPLGSFVGTISAGPSEYRNIPLIDASGTPVILRFDGSAKTLRLSERTTGNNADDSAILQNYFILVPTADPGTLRPVVSYASPTPGQTVTPSGRNENSSPETTVTIANRDTSVNIGTVVFKMNGATVPSAAVQPTLGGAIVTWSFADTPATATITNSVTFSDSGAVQQTFTWTYAYPFLRASNSLPVSALTARGIRTHTVWNANSENAGEGLGNALIRAEGQLAYPPTPTPEPGDVDATNIIQMLYWNNDNATPNDVPGLSAGPLDNIATESLGYIHLTAGPHRFRVDSDDGWRMASGSVVTGFRDGGTYGGTFDFIAEANGLYPLRFVWYENEGGASLRVRVVNLSDNSLTELNDPGNPAGVVEVYNPNYSLTLQSATVVGGPYTADASAIIIDRTARTVTVPVSGTRKYFRLVGDSAIKITSVTKVGNNLVITYQFQ